MKKKEQESIMAFDSLTKRLGKAFKNVTGKGKLSEKNMEDMLREVRMSLLEADVNYKVVKQFIEDIKVKAMGVEVMDSLNPGEMVVKVVRDELVTLLGENESEISFKESGVSTIMMVGLQGTGKTTATAKIANVLQKKKNRKVLLAACDIIRPAAIEQLQVLGEQIGCPVYTKGIETSALETAKQALSFAKENQYDTVIFDTAGRLHIDDELMHELQLIKNAVNPDEILLTVDAMTGQDIVGVAETFNEKLDVTGLVLTKLDGDSRGGGILSVRAITGVPVKFTGLGEKIDDLDIFYPERMAERILGMGDIMTLIEQAQDKMDVDVAEKSAKRMMEGKFDLNDMLAQFQQLKKMGSMSKLVKMIPGLNQMADQLDEAKADQGMKKNEAIILSMTLAERKDPSIMKSSRKTRVAQGSGTQVSDVNRLLSQFEKTKQAMKQMSRMAQGGSMPNMPGMGGMPNMGAMTANNGGQKKFVSKLKRRR